jgi:hypothetical protein
MGESARAADTETDAGVAADDLLGVAAVAAVAAVMVAIPPIRLEEVLFVERSHVWPREKSSEKSRVRKVE